VKDKRGLAVTALFLLLRKERKEKKKRKGKPTA